MDGIPPFSSDANGILSSKKAAHVKWAGKTIALGTFSLKEAEEKCSKAKALTRAWRTTMRPRPSRDWVIGELERLGVRVVSGRSGKDTDGQDDDQLSDGDDDDDHTYTEPPGGGMVTERPENFHYRDDSIGSFPRFGLSNERPDNLTYRQESITSTILSEIDVEHDRPDDVHCKREGAPQRRNASTGIALLGNVVTSGKDTASSNKSYRSQDQQVLPPAYRPLVGDGAAAAYNVLKEDHYMKLAAEKKAAAHLSSAPRATKGPIVADSAQRSEKLPSLLNNNLPAAPLYVRKSHGCSDAHHHYEMLKIHHLNLMKEIQETTIMMNIFQQQILAQQQEKVHEDLARPQLLQQQLKQKQQFNLSNISTQQLGLDNEAYKQAPPQMSESFKAQDPDHRTNMPVHMPRIIETSSSSNHSLKGFSAGADFISHGNFSSSGHIKPKKARKFTPSSYITGVEDPQRAQRLQLEHLKAEILEKQALLAVMSQNVGQNQEHETTMQEANYDRHNSNNDFIENVHL